MVLCLIKEMNWITQIRDKDFKIYSQYGQDGMIEFIFQQIGVTNKFCVEFGFNSETLDGGSGSNVARLVIEDGWKPLLLDRDFSNPDINLHKATLTPDNLPQIFKAFNVPLQPDYVSIDVDGIDLWLMLSMLADGYRPRLISIEYNSNFPLGVSRTMRSDSVKWDGTKNYGASLTALNNVAKQYDYQLVSVLRGADLFFLRGGFAYAEELPSLETFAFATGVKRHSGRIDETKFVEFP